jgi:hypothetical protein
MVPEGKIKLSMNQNFTISAIAAGIQTLFYMFHLLTWNTVQQFFSCVMLKIQKKCEIGTPLTNHLLCLCIKMKLDMDIPHLQFLNVHDSVILHLTYLCNS